MFEKYGVHLNIYNCSVHIHRHIEQKDLVEAEATKVRWAEIDAKMAEEAKKAPKQILKN